MAYPKVKVRKIKRSKGFVYGIDYTIEGKRHREIVSESKREADAIAGQMQSDFALGKFNLAAEKKIVVSTDSLINEYLANLQNTVKPSSIKRYTNHLDRFKIFLQTNFPSAADNIRLIKQIYIKECINDALDIDNKRKLAPETVNRMLQSIGFLFNYALQQEYIVKNPTKHIKSIPIPESNKPEFFSKEDLDSIWKVVDPFWKPFLQFLYYTGLRKGELINLTWQNVCLENNPPEIRITSTKDWTTKTGKSRTIQLHKNALSILKKQVGKDDKFAFTSRNGYKIHPDKPYHALKRALKELGLRGDVHKLRHTFASHLVMKGVSIYELKELLGHADLESTQIYAHLSPKHKQGVIDKLD